jgi:voltage-gated potassium channel
MPIMRAVWQRLYVAIATLSWGVLGLAFLAHMLLSWLLLWWAGESELTTDALTFAYYYMTTATTVGYGDLSPALPGGRLAAILVLLPGAIALFTAFLGKTITAIGSFWRRRLQGQGNFSDRQGHTLVVGWQENRSRQLVEGLMADGGGAARIVLIAPGLDSSPLPDTVDFVSAQSLSDLESFARAGAAGASTIVVRGASDDETLAATLAAEAAAPNAHLVAFFQDEGAARLIRNRLPRVEVITSLATHLLIRSARDPGTSRLAALMFSHSTVDTAFWLKVPEEAETSRYFDLMCGLKKRAGVTLIGICRRGGSAVDLNCPPDLEVRAGDTLYYIADTRIDAERIHWGARAREAA